MYIHVDVFSLETSKFQGVLFLMEDKLCTQCLIDKCLSIHTMNKLYENVHGMFKLGHFTVVAV